MVTYTHSKAITRASCRLIWYPTGERVRCCLWNALARAIRELNSFFVAATISNSDQDSITTDDMLDKLAAYHRHHLDYEMQPSERNYYQSKLRAHKNGMDRCRLKHLKGC